MFVSFMESCAPGNHFKDGSCMPLEILVELAKAYNRDNPNKLIKLNSNNELLDRKKYKMYLVNRLTNRLGSVCTTQRCWTMQPFVENMEMYKYLYLKNRVFRPRSPAGKFSRLSKTNIDNVLRQYETKYKDFIYYSAVPIDFKDLNLEINSISSRTLTESGKNRIGVVFNLDEHYKPGSHWVSLYTDIQTGTCFYFDSFGIPPEKRIRDFIKKIAGIIQENNLEPICRYNKTRHQFGTTECGVYAMYFIISQLEGANFYDITDNPISDTEINKYRDVYFSKY